MRSLGVRSPWVKHSIILIFKVIFLHQNSSSKIKFKNQFRELEILKNQVHIDKGNEGINQRYLKNWVDVPDKICFGHT